MMIINPYKFSCLSSDTKPTGVSIGSTCLEWDTQRLFITPDGDQWVMAETSKELTVTTQHDLNQAAASRTLFTATAQNIFVDGVSIYVPVDVSAVETFTGISIQSTDDTPVVFVSSTVGAKASLTAGKIISYRGPGIVASTKLIQLTIIGGATGVACNCTVFVMYRAVVAGGYLA